MLIFILAYTIDRRMRNGQRNSSRVGQCSLRPVRQSCSGLRCHLASPFAKWALSVIGKKVLPNAMHYSLPSRGLLTVAIRRNIQGFEPWHGATGICHDQKHLSSPPTLLAVFLVPLGVFNVSWVSQGDE